MDGHLRVDRRAQCLLGLHRPPKARAQRQKERPSGAKRNINHCTGGIQNTAHRPKPMWDLIAHDKGGTLNENATTKNQESINPKHSTQNLLPNKDYRLFFRCTFQTFLIKTKGRHTDIRQTQIQHSFNRFLI